MTHGFDKDFWERHWQAGGTGSFGGDPPNPYLSAEITGLATGTALDAGCGTGAEAIWLAAHGWHVTAVDISAAALARAAERTAASGDLDHLRWVEADLSVWSPSSQFDLVMTNYAHAAMPQLDFYDRIGGWVAPGGTLLIVGHLDTPGSTESGHQPGYAGHGHQPPAEASVTAAAITARMDGSEWEIITAEEPGRSVPGQADHTVSLHDVVVRATRCRSPHHPPRPIYQPGSHNAERMRASASSMIEENS